MRNVLTNLTASLLRSSAITSVMLSATNATLAFSAFREWFTTGSELNNAWATVLAGMVAVTVGGVLHVTYTGVLRGVPAVDRLQRPKIFPVIGVLGAFVLSMSTYANVTVTAGADAIEIHEAQQIDAMLGATGQLQTAALSVGQLSPALASDAEKLSRKAQCEAEAGCLSGAPGTGALTDALISAAGKVEGAAGATNHAGTKIAALIPQLDDAFARKDNTAIRSLSAQIRASIPFDRLSALARNLRADLGIVPDGRSAAVRARQAEAIAQLQKELAAIADGLDRTSARLRADLDAVALPDRETITKAKAIWIYAEQLVPQIALGVSLDWVLIVFAFFMAKLRDATPAEEDDVSDISLADARRNHRELMRLMHDVSDEPASPEPEEQEAPEPEPPVEREQEQVLDIDLPPQEEDHARPKPSIAVPLREAAE